MHSSLAFDEDFGNDPAGVLGPPAIKCLLVDDDQFDRYNVRYAAERAGLNLTFYDAASVAEARQMLHTQTYALIILDQNLPDGQGLDLAMESAMSSLNAKTPTIMLTGLEDKRLVAGAQKAGCVEFLTKNDLTGETLSAALRRALEKSIATIEAHDFPEASDAFEMMLDGFGELYLAQTIKPVLARMMFLTNQIQKRPGSMRIMQDQDAIAEIGALCQMIWDRVDPDSQKLREKPIN